MSWLIKAIISCWEVLWLAIWLYRSAKFANDDHLSYLQKDIREKKQINSSVAVAFDTMILLAFSSVTRNCVDNYLHFLL